MRERWGIPFDIQQKGVTPVSTVLTAATGIVTLCTVDVVVVWVWLTILILTLQKFTQSKHIFTTVSGSPDHRQFWDGQRSKACMVAALSMAIRA